jgi:hypothetical protein
MKLALVGGLAIGLLYGISSYNFSSRSTSTPASMADGVTNGASTSSTSGGWPASGGSAGNAAFPNVDWGNFANLFSADLGIGPNPDGIGSTILPGQLADVPSLAGSFTESQAWTSYYYDSYNPSTGQFSQTWLTYITAMLDNFGVDWSGFNDPPGTGGSGPGGGL